MRRVRKSMKKKINGEKARVKALERELKRNRALLFAMEKRYRRALRERDALLAQKEALQVRYDVIANSATWRITYPFRRFLDAVKHLLGRFAFFRLAWKVASYLRRDGLRASIRKIKLRFIENKRKRGSDQSKISKEERERQEKTTFEKTIRFSILVPLYNTPAQFLEEMINSVLEQTYPVWELCLADGSDEDHADVMETVRKKAARDMRIKYRKLEKNLGISENTNACIEMATGDYFALLDHDDVLHPSALFEMMRAICERDADFVYTDEITFSRKRSRAYCPHYKPDFSPDLLRSYNYICHFSCFSRALFEKVGGFRSEFDGSQDYDMILRLTEQAECIVHIPKILYFWRSHEGSVASKISAKPYTLKAAKKALTEHLARVHLDGVVSDAKVPSTYRIRYRLEKTPLVSIVIPNMDHAQLLKKCIDSVKNRTTYSNYEILIVENNSKKRSTFAYYRNVTKQYSNVRLIRWRDEFNYSAINNFAVKQARGEYLIFLNNDIEILSPEWIEEVLMFAQRGDVGAVGMMLYYPDNTVQHAGVILGIGGIAGHSHKYFKRGEYGYMSRMTLVQNLSAVTAAAMMVRASVFQEVGGFDTRLRVAFNDVDLCMKIRRAGYLIVFTPYAEAYHYESKSRGAEDTPQKRARFQGEVELFREKWGDVLDAGDPYYNPNLSLAFEDFRLK